MLSIVFKCNQMAKKTASLLIKMISSEGTGYFYVRKKNPKKKPEKLEGFLKNCWFFTAALLHAFPDFYYVKNARMYHVLYIIQQNAQKSACLFTNNWL